MLSRKKDKVTKLLYPFMRFLEKTHISPDGVTIIGFLLSLLIVPLVVFLNYIMACIMVFVTGFFDALDGAYARMINRVTPRGGFLDSVLDRYSDAIIMVAIIYAGLCSVVWGIIALIGSLLVSYTRARVEAFGVVKRFVVGFAERPVRLLLIGSALLLENWFPRTINYVVIALAILTHITVLQRSVYARDLLSEPKKQEPRVSTEKQVSKRHREK
nr:CDP-alcohol phosphatidyltransferase family protein [Candidatus Njordarchaeota archaeon]